MFAMENGKIWRGATKIVQIFNKMDTYYPISIIIKSITALYLKKQISFVHAKPIRIFKR